MPGPGEPSECMHKLYLFRIFRVCRGDVFTYENTKFHVKISVLLKVMKVLVQSLKKT